MLRVRERLRLGEEDVRVEDVERIALEGVKVPAERPEVEPRVGTFGEAAGAGIEADRRGEREEKRRVDDGADREVRTNLPTPIEPSTWIPAFAGTRTMPRFPTSC